MTDEITSRSNGAGQSVNVVISEGAAKWLAIAMAILFLGSIGIAVSALDRASQAEATAETAHNAAILAEDAAARSTWTMMNLEGLLTAHGIDVPAQFKPKGHDGK